MADLQPNLEIERCPHCGVAKPNATRIWEGATTSHSSHNQRIWATYACSSCGGVILAYACTQKGPIQKMWPETKELSDAIPKRPRTILEEARRSIGGAPSGAIMLTASAVDWMLRVKGYSEGSLYTRIDKASADHIITDGMREWAHHVRLEANEERHPDENVPLPSLSEAEQCLEFAMALAQFLFVLPSRVTKGLQEAHSKSASS